jgi:hypothetical protein
VSSYDAYRQGVCISAGYYGSYIFGFPKVYFYQTVDCSGKMQVVDLSTECIAVEEDDYGGGYSYEYYDNYDLGTVDLYNKWELVLASQTAIFQVVQVKTIKIDGFLRSTVLMLMLLSNYVDATRH